MKFISDGGASEKSIQTSLEGGACTIYVHGGSADRFAYEGKIDEIAKYLEMIRSRGILPASALTGLRLSKPVWMPE